MSTSAIFEKGTKVLIKETVNVRQRFPELSGSVATVLITPYHPNTWYTVRTHDNREIKLQTSAMQVINEEDYSEDKFQEEQDGFDKKSFRVGDHVRIVESAANRGSKPNHVGKVGKIQELPLHPNTWYTVKIDGKSVRCQAPSLKPIEHYETPSDEDGSDETEDDEEPAKKKKEHDSDNESDYTEHTISKDKRDDKNETDADDSKDGMEVLDEEEDQEAKAVDSEGDRSSQQALHPGARVVILRTNNVEQRVPHLVGKIGTIKYIPQHPNTWLKVAFPDGKCFTFRQSALQLAPESPDKKSEIEEKESADEFSKSQSEQKKGKGEDLDGKNDFPGIEKDARVVVVQGSESRQSVRAHIDMIGVVNEIAYPWCHVLMDSSGQVVKIHITNLQLAPNESAKAAEPEKDTQAVGSLLSKVDPDTWVGKRVMVNVGKFDGLTGVVTRSGNGWVQLILDETHEQTAKRAYELTLMKDQPPLPESRPQLKRRRSQSMDSKSSKTTVTPAASPPTAPSSIVASKDNAEEDTTETEDNGSKRSRRIASRSGSTSVNNISFVGKEVMLPDRRVGIVRRMDRGICSVEIGTSRVSVKKDLLKLYVSNDDEQATVTRSSDRNSKRSRNDSRKKDTHNVAASQLSAFREQVKRHLAKQMDRIKNRPNLKEWLYKIEMENPENLKNYEMDDSVVDLFSEYRCKTCNFEKQNPDNYCWNEACPTSPVFVDNPENNDKPFSLSISPMYNPFVTSALEHSTPVGHRNSERDSPRMRLVRGVSSEDPSQYRWKLRAVYNYSSSPKPLPDWDQSPPRKIRKEKKPEQISASQPLQQFQPGSSSPTGAMHTGTNATPVVPPLKSPLLKSTATTFPSITNSSGNAVSGVSTKGGQQQSSGQNTVLHKQQRNQATIPTLSMLKLSPNNNQHTLPSLPAFIPPHQLSTELRNQTKPTGVTLAPVASSDSSKFPVFGNSGHPTGPFPSQSPPPLNNAPRSFLRPSPTNAIPAMMPHQLFRHMNPKAPGDAAPSDSSNASGIGNSEKAPMLPSWSGK